MAKFQKLLEYANGPHGSQLALDVNTQMVVKAYQDTQNTLRSVKEHLKEDIEYIRRTVDSTSEESDCRVSFMESCLSSPVYKDPIPCSTLSSEEFLETTLRKSLAIDVAAISSADETDEECLVRKMHFLHELTSHFKQINIVILCIDKYCTIPIVLSVFIPYH